MSRFNLNTTSAKVTTMAETKYDEVPKAVRNYTLRFLHKNQLGMYLKGFKKLDNIVNLFFLSYASIQRSSLNCARLWVGVMQVRTMMTNVITHLLDQPRYISKDYKNIRMTELYTHITDCQTLVAKSVQYIETFKKHEEEHDWYFLRKGFLDKLSKSLHNAMFEACFQWREFTIAGFDLKETTKLAYIEHLASQEAIFREALKSVEPKSKVAQRNSFHVAQLKKLYKMRNTAEVQEHDYGLLREKLCTVEDCLGTENFITDPNADVDNFTRNNNSLIYTIRSFLRDNVPETVLINDSSIWQHQLGMETLGPFEYLDIPNPNAVFNVDVGRKEFTLKPDFLLIDGLGGFNGRIGQMSKLNPISLPPHILNELGIPKKTSKFCWVFPLFDENLDDPERTIFHAKNYSPLHVLCMYGGFAYFDTQENLLSIKGITAGDDLYFDGPYFIPNPDAYSLLQSDYHVVFNKANPVGPLHFIDVLGYAWIHRDQSRPFDVESVGGGSKNWEFAGGFAFEFDNNMFHGEKLNEDDPSTDLLRSKIKDRRVYFQVLTFSELQDKKKKNMNTPNVSQLKLLYDNYRDEWSERDKDGNIMKTYLLENLFKSEILKE